MQYSLFEYVPRKPEETVLYRVVATTVLISTGTLTPGAGVINSAKDARQSVVGLKIYS